MVEFRPPGRGGELVQLFLIARSAQQLIELTNGLRHARFGGSACRENRNPSVGSPAPVLQVGPRFGRLHTKASRGKLRRSSRLNGRRCLMRSSSNA